MMGVETLKPHAKNRSEFKRLQKITGMAQATGSENICYGSTLSGGLATGPVLSPSRITPENNGKIRPQPDRENAFARASGGSGGIRTHGTVPRTLVFKTRALNHSATLPCPVR